MTTMSHHFFCRLPPDVFLLSRAEVLPWIQSSQIIFPSITTSAMIIFGDEHLDGGEEADACRKAAHAPSPPPLAGGRGEPHLENWT